MGKRKQQTNQTVNTQKRRNAKTKTNIKQPKRIWNEENNKRIKQLKYTKEQNDSDKHNNNKTQKIIYKKNTKQIETPKHQKVKNTNGNKNKQAKQQ